MKNAPAAIFSTVSASCFASTSEVSDATNFSYVSLDCLTCSFACACSPTREVAERVRAP